MKTMYKNMLRSVIIYIVISVINFVIYALTFPETPLYERYSNIFYVGPILNIAISILGYSLAGRSMQTSGKKIKNLVSLSIPAVAGGVFVYAAHSAPAARTFSTTLAVHSAPMANI